METGSWENWVAIFTPPSLPSKPFHPTRLAESFAENETGQKIPQCCELCSEQCWTSLGSPGSAYSLNFLPVLAGE